MKSKDYAIQHFQVTQHAITRYRERIEDVRSRRVRPQVVKDLRKRRGHEGLWERVMTGTCTVRTKRAQYVFKQGHLVTVLKPVPFGERFVEAQRRAWIA